ncbi:MAG: ATP-grasp domain-containing protein [Planctomycetota bacterium]
MISPGFPADMPHFTRGLAQVGATVLGVGDQPKAALEEPVKEALTAYLQVAKLWDEERTVGEVTAWLEQHKVKVDRVECMWEPGVVLAAKLRERLGCPGLSVEQAHWFRDKESMKQVLDRAGIRTPHHYRARTKQEVRDAAARVGFPAIVKPIDGAGSADTYTLRSEQDLEAALTALGHINEVSVEEFIEGEEFTYDAICADGRVLFENVAWYRPKPLVARQNPWISPQAICMRHLDMPEIAGGVDLGRRVLAALGQKSGFTHMEWFRKPDGEVVFGEIGARSPGGRLTHGMNVSIDGDLFVGWAEALTKGRITQDLSKRYNTAIVFKRAEGGGDRIARIEGLQRIMAEEGHHIPLIDLVPVGAPRRDWRQVVTGDGWIVARHADLGEALRLADRLSGDLRIFAG